jgi:hypothetical protein
MFERVFVTVLVQSISRLLFTGYILGGGNVYRYTVIEEFCHVLFCAKVSRPDKVFFI